MSSRTHTHKAFSTLEILIAMSVLLLVTSAIILVSFGNQTAVANSEAGMEALHKTQELLERQQALARKDFKLVNATTSPDGIYQKTITVNPIDFFTKEVTASVSWVGDRNKTHTTELSALITNFGAAVGGDTCYSTLSGDWTRPEIKNANPSLASLISNDTGGLYPITDLDVHQQKIYVTVGAPNPNVVGPRSGNSATNMSGTGTVSWGSVNGALTNGSGTASVSLGSNATSRYLAVTGFGSALNIPHGATIMGIQVEVRRSPNSANSISDNQVRLIKSDGTLSSGDKPRSGTWGTGTTNVTYGNSSDLWNEEWNSDDINNANFGVAFSVRNTVSGNRTANVDHITVTVTFRRQFYVLDLASPTNPSFAGGLASNPMAPPVNAGFNAVAVAQSASVNYAYVATNSSTGQLQIIDLSKATPIATSTLQVGSTNGVGNAIAYKDGYVYLGLTHIGTGPEFYVIDVHTPNNPQVVGSATIGHDVNGIYIQNDRAYVATPNSNNLVVYDIAVDALSTSMTPIGSFAGTGSSHGKSLYVVGDTVYLGRTLGTNELYIIDTGDTPFLDMGRRDFSGSGTSINGIITRDFLTFFMNTAGQLQIWRTDNPSSISRYDTTNVTVASDTNFTPLECEGNYLYVGSTRTSSGSISIIGPQ